MEGRRRPGFGGARRRDPVLSVGYRCEYDDIYGDWTRLRATDEGGAILARPDRYIGWRCATMPADPVAALRATMTTILAR